MGNQEEKLVFRHQSILISDTALAESAHLRQTSAHLAMGWSDLNWSQLSAVLSHTSTHASANLAVP
jgi:hypothetical protein